MHDRMVAELPDPDSGPGSPGFPSPPSPGDDADLGCRLFIASTIDKNDDVAELHTSLDNRAALRVLDICGGYGRFRFHWPSPVEAWRVIDRSAPLARLGGAIARARRIAPLTFVHGDVLDAVGLQGERPYDLVICAHNAINELPEIAPLLTLARDSLSVGGLFFLKAISLDPSDVEVSPWPAETFRFDGETWRSSIYGVNQAHRQTLHTVFHATGSGRSHTTITPRWIWPLALIDDLAAAHGFQRIHVGRQLGFRIYRKTL